MGWPTFTLFSALFSAVVIVAALRDLTSFTIPNWISLSAIALFVPAALSAHIGWTAFGVSLAVGAVALILGMGMFAAGWIGGGDAKLFAACGLWMGLPAAAPFVIFTALAGGALAVFLLWSRRVIRPIAGRGPAWFGRLMTPDGDVPYGLAIAVGALAAFPASALMQAASRG